MCESDKKELHRRVMVLKGLMKDGKLLFPEEQEGELVRSFQKVRFGSDGFVDPDSVDGRVRATLLAVVGMADREEAKSAISFGDIQRHYFERLEIAFGELHAHMIEEKSSPNEIARWVASNQDKAETNIKFVQDIVRDIRNFWDKTSDVSWIHGQDSKAVKGVFGGDIFPTDRVNLAASCGLFFDTVIIPDPLKRMNIFLQNENHQQNIYDCIRFGLKALAYKDYAVAELDIPIAAVVPDKLIDDKFYSDFLRVEVEADLLKFMQRQFGEDFDCVENFNEYIGGYASSGELFEKIRYPEEVIIYAGDNRNLLLQFESFVEEVKGYSNAQTPGMAFSNMVLGRLFQATDLLRRGSELNGTPIITAPNSWEWFKWKLKSESGVGIKDRETLHIARALRVAADSDLSWLGNIPADALVEMRKAGAIDEIREMMRLGLTDFGDLNDADFGKTTENFIENVQATLLSHQKKIDVLKKKRWKFAGKDIASFLVHGGIAVTAALSMSPVVLVGAALYSLAGPTPKIQDVIQRQKQLGKDNKAAMQTPIGMLFSLSENSGK